MKKRTPQRVVIAGLGRYPQGSGVSAAFFFAKRGDDVLVTDQKKAADLGNTVRVLRRFKNVRFVFGAHRLSDVRGADVVVRNPGMRTNAPLLKEARRLEIPIETDITLFLKSCPAPVVGITGTRGKSTTSTLVAEMLKASGHTAWLGGNIQVSPLTFLQKVRPAHKVVLELSSWMVETMEEQGLTTDVALITNVLQDHLNAYPNIRAYARAKEGLFVHQASDHVGIFCRDQSMTRDMAKRTLGQRWWWSAKLFAEENGGFARGNAIVVRVNGKESVVARKTDLQITGAHNWANAIAASTAAVAMGATPAGIRTALRTFHGLPDRQEEIAVVEGVRWINDTTATTPDALIAALTACTPPRGRLILIAGGSDKELPFSDAAKAMKKYVSALVFLPGTGTDRLHRALKQGGFRAPTIHVDSMDFAVRAAAAVAKRGDVVLLSPACASFGLFKNEFDRGDQFRKAVGV